MNQRPQGVTILAILDAAGVLIGVLTIGVVLVLAASVPDLDAFLIAYGLLSAASLGLSIVISAIRGWALWTLQPWGRVFTMVLAGIGLLGFPIGTIYGGFLLWYMSRPHVRAAFAAGPIPFSLSGAKTKYRPEPSGPGLETALPPARPIQRPLTSAWLVDEDGTGSYQLNLGDTRLGRGAGNDVALADPAISREHALIREEKGRFTIYDRASAYGTFVNEQRVAGPVLLQQGDMIRLGDTSLRLIYRD